MTADKTHSKEEPPEYHRAKRYRRRRTNSEIRWFLYGALPVVIGGLLLMGTGIGIMCTSNTIPDLLNICPVPDGDGGRKPGPYEVITPATDTPTASSTTVISPTTGIPPITTTAPPTTAISPTTGIPPITTTAPPTTAISPTTGIPPITTTAPPTTVIPPITAIPPDPVDPQAEEQAKDLAPRFEDEFNIRTDPNQARGLNASRIGGPEGQLAGMVAPAIDANQNYVDNNNTARQVMGILSLNDSRLTMESMLLVDKATIQRFNLPLGAYVITCHPVRRKDCVAVSLQGEEFQIDPETIDDTDDDPSVSAPIAFYEDGSIKKCYKVLRRKICVRVFR